MTVPFAGGSPTSTLARKTRRITRGVDVPVFGSVCLKQLTLQLLFLFLPT